MIVFIRFSAFVVMVPFFKNKNFSMVLKIAFAFIISLLVFPSLNISDWYIPENLLGFIIFILEEFVIGILMGLVILIILFILELIGHLVGFQMAFSMARAVDSTTNTQTNVIGVIFIWVGTMVFLAMGGDHYLLYSIKESFSVITPGHIIVTRILISELSNMIVNSFVMGFKMASPAIIVLLSIDITLGIIGKTASKMQIFFVGLPLKISMGLFIVTFILGFIKLIWSGVIDNLPEIFGNLFQFMRI
jgi:flagellar biosynthetic protein FliR